MFIQNKRPELSKNLSFISRDGVLQRVLSKAALSASTCMFAVPCKLIVFIIPAFYFCFDIKSEFMAILSKDCDLILLGDYFYDFNGFSCYFIATVLGFKFSLFFLFA